MGSCRRRWVGGWWEWRVGQLLYVWRAAQPGQTDDAWKAVEIAAMARAGRPSHQTSPTHLLSVQLKPGNSDAALLAALHPTPAVCGRPREDALGFLAASEPFDRGYYAGPFGWLSQGAAEFVVAIRSALVQPTGAATSSNAAASGQLSDRLASHAAAGPGPQSPPVASAAAAPSSPSAVASPSTVMMLYAGVGIVRGSDTAQEWAELDLKVRQYERLLQGAPPLSASPNVNALWARLLVEELCRLGCNTFCVAPGEPDLWLVLVLVVLLLRLGCLAWPNGFCLEHPTFLRHYRHSLSASTRPAPPCRLPLLAPDSGCGAAPPRPHRPLHR